MRFESAALSLGLCGKRELCGQSPWCVLEQKVSELAAGRTGVPPCGPWESDWTSEVPPPAHFQQVF